MKKPEPKCLYCGETMKIHVSEFYNGLFAVGYAVCPACGSYGPTVKAATDEEVKRIHDDCEAAALRRPLHKPLTKKELRALIDAGHEVVVYCETKQNKRELYGTILYEGEIFDRYGKAPGPKCMRWETYGKTWRAWATRPTDEERAAAPWEE